MQVLGRPYRTIWFDPDAQAVQVIDQRRLPHALQVATLRTPADFAVAIRDMWIRGAPLIGATAAWGIATAMAADPTDAALDAVCAQLGRTRPTAINLHWAIGRMRDALRGLAPAARAAEAHRLATALCDADVETNRRIGEHGLALIRAVAARKRPGEPVEILTHCNAGWLATVDRGTATAPIYAAHDAGIALHVWVDETRPRNQGAALTCWELGSHGVPHTLVADNAGGHLMQQGRVDLVIVGSDRTTATGDVCNKIGTYLKALAARDNDVPFYVALPGTTIDWTIDDGRAGIPIEERDPGEVTHVVGLLDAAAPIAATDPADAAGAVATTGAGRVVSVRIAPAGTPAANPAFDVTPARLVTGLITEAGVLPASRAGLAPLRPVS